MLISPLRPNPYPIPNSKNTKNTEKSFDSLLDIKDDKNKSKKAESKKENQAPMPPVSAAEVAEEQRKWAIKAKMVALYNKIKAMSMMGNVDPKSIQGMIAEYKSLAAQCGGGGGGVNAPAQNAQAGGENLQSSINSLDRFLSTGQMPKTDVPQTPTNTESSPSTPAVTNVNTTPTNSGDSPQSAEGNSESPESSGENGDVAKTEEQKFAEEKQNAIAEEDKGMQEFMQEIGALLKELVEKAKKQAKTEEEREEAQKAETELEKVQADTQNITFSQTPSSESTSSIGNLGGINTPSISPTPSLNITV